MKNLTVKITGQYASSNATFTGTKKQVLNFLRVKASELRRSSRLSRNLADSVHSIPENSHPSKLVTMASFKLNDMGIEKLIELMNAHGVIKYSVC